MIDFQLSITNPWSNRFESIWDKTGDIIFTKHLHWEVQLMKTNDIFSLEARFTTRQDHAGYRKYLGLFGYAISFQVYDERHWDYENNCWVNYDGSTI